MVKSPDAFRTIREVAEWLDTPAHVLRFWESRFAQVKPVKRAGGRRYYRPSDMELLGGIKQLLHEDGLTIRGVQKLLREHGVRHVAAKSPALGLESTEKRAMSDPEGGAERPAGPAAPEPAQGPDHAEAPPPRSVANAGAFHAAAGSHEPAQEPGPRPAAAAPAHGPATGSEAGPASPMAEGANSGPPRSTSAAPSAAQAAPGEGSPPAGAPGPRPATEAAPPAGRPILPALWERRRSGDLDGAGAALARARALLRSMDARD